MLEKFILRSRLTVGQHVSALSSVSMVCVFSVNLYCFWDQNCKFNWLTKDWNALFRNMLITTSPGNYAFNEAEVERQQIHTNCEGWSKMLLKDVLQCFPSLFREVFSSNSSEIKSDEFNMHPTGEILSLNYSMTVQKQLKMANCKNWSKVHLGGFCTIVFCPCWQTFMPDKPIRWKDTKLDWSFSFSWVKYTESFSAKMNWCIKSTTTLIQLDYQWSKDCTAAIFSPLYCLRLISAMLLSNWGLFEIMSTSAALIYTSAFHNDLPLHTYSMLSLNLHH